MKLQGGYLHSYFLVARTLQATEDSGPLPGGNIANANRRPPKLSDSDFLLTNIGLKQISETRGQIPYQ